MIKGEPFWFLVVSELSFRKSADPNPRYAMITLPPHRQPHLNPDVQIMLLPTPETTSACVTQIHKLANAPSPTPPFNRSLLKQDIYVFPFHRKLQRRL